MMNKNMPQSLRCFAGLAACALLACTTARARAQAPQPGDVDTTNSRVYVHVGATGLGHEHGVEGKLTSGNVQLGAQQGAGRLVFDINSFTADTPTARKYVGLTGEADGTQVTANMLSAEVLDAANFPQATFTIGSATRDPASGQNMLNGQFALHGVSQNIQVPAQAELVNGMIHLRGQFSILQTNYGITPYKKLLGTVGVADQLTIYGDIWLHAR